MREKDASHDSRFSAGRGSRSSRSWSSAVCLEQLETRQLLSAIAVNSLADNTTSGDGLVTLREAIAAANNDTTTDLGQTGDGADTISFDTSLFSGGAGNVTFTNVNDAPTPTIVSIGTPRVEGTAISVTGSAYSTGSGSDYSFTPDDNGSYRIGRSILIGGLGSDKLTGGKGDYATSTAATECR